MAKVTSKDIAARAGVSPAAVSMAIRGKKGISKATRAHILRVAREMNYELPGAAARESMGKSLAVVVDPASAQADAAFLRELLSFAVGGGAELHVYSLAQALEGPAPAGCDLLLVLGEPERTALDTLSAMAPQLLVLDSSFSRRPYPNIRLDYAGAAYRLAGHLADMGHRNIAFINEELPNAKNLICFSGFQRLMLERKLPIDPTQVVMDAGRDAHVWTHLEDIVTKNNISAIVCTSEQAALRAAGYLRQAGLRIPEDVSIAAIVPGGDGSHPSFSLTRVSLCVGTAVREISRACARPLPPGADSDILIAPGEVCPGESACPPRFDPSAKRLGFALYLRDHPVMRVARAGFLNSVQQMGYQAEVVSTPGSDSASFTEAARALLDMNVDGVVLWLPVPEAIAMFREAGIPMVCLHGIAESPEALGIQSNITQNTANVGRDVAEFFTRRLQGLEGGIVVTRSDDNLLESGIAREFVRLMAESCPQIRFLGNLDFAHPTEENTRLATEFIRQHPDLLGVFTTAGGTCASWADAKRATGRDNLLIVGTDYTDESLALLDSGEIQAFVAQPIYEETQTSVVALDTILRGGEFPTVCRLEGELVTKDRMDKYSRLLQEIRNWYT